MRKDKKVIRQMKGWRRGKETVRGWLKDMRKRRREEELALMSSGRTGTQRLHSSVDPGRGNESHTSEGQIPQHCCIFQTRRESEGGGAMRQKL